MLCASRRLNRIVPSGRVTRPQTTSLSVPTCLTTQIGTVHGCPAGVVTGSGGLLAGPSLPFASSAFTV